MGKRGSSKQDGRKQDRLPNQLPDDMYDDVDKFHKENDLRFETEMDEDEDLDGEEEEGVMDLDDSDEADSDDDLEAGGQLAKSMQLHSSNYELHMCGCSCVLKLCAPLLITAPASSSFSHSRGCF